MLIFAHASHIITVILAALNAVRTKAALALSNDVTCVFKAARKQPLAFFTQMTRTSSVQEYHLTEVDMLRDRS